MSFWQLGRTTSHTELSNSAHKRAVTLTFAQYTQLSRFFLTHHNFFRNSSLSRRYILMSIETNKKKMVNELFVTWKNRGLNRVLKLINKFHCFNIQMGFSWPTSRSCLFNTCIQYTADYALFNSL